MALFAEAYLHAFAYLLSPCLRGKRPLIYPTIAKRVEFLIRASQRIGVNVPQDYANLFDQQSGPTDFVEKMWVSVADDAVENHVEDAISEAIAIAAAKNIPPREPSRIAEIKKDFQMVMPSNGEKHLTDVLNAAWECHHEPTLWQDVPHIRQSERRRILHDLVLKSLEVSEYFQRIAMP